MNKLNIFTEVIVHSVVIWQIIDFSLFDENMKCIGLFTS